MTTTAREEFHAAHRHWKSDIAACREDVDRWRREQGQFLGELEKAVSAHDERLVEHADEVRTHEAEVADHERFAAECERTARRTDSADESWADAHAGEEEWHRTLRDEHMRLMHGHHAAMARLALARRLLSAPA